MEGEKKKYCSRCGAEIPDNVKFCTKCGQRVESDTQTQEQSAKEAQPAINLRSTTESSAKRTGANKKIIIIGILVVVVIIGVVLMSGVLSKGKPTGVQPTVESAEEETETSPAATEEVMETESASVAESNIAGYDTNLKINTEYVYDNGQSIISTAVISQKADGLYIDVSAMGYGGHGQGFASGYLVEMGEDMYSCTDDNDFGTFIVRVSAAGLNLVMHADSSIQDQAIGEMYDELGGDYVILDDTDIAKESEEQYTTEAVKNEMGMIPDSSGKILTDADLAGLSKEDLRIAINEIYARHGRIFKDAELQTWFNAQPWYQGTIAPEQFDENVLSQIEKDNIKFLKSKQEGAVSNQTSKAFSGLYEITFGNQGGAELEITYGSGDDIFTADFGGSYVDAAGGTSGYLNARTDGSDGIWDYYEDGSYEASMSLQYDGADTITVTSTDGNTFGGMDFPGFAGTYKRTKEYPMP